MVTELSQWDGSFLRPLSSWFSSTRPRCSWNFIWQERSEWNCSQKDTQEPFPNLWDLDKNIPGHFPILREHHRNWSWISCVCFPPREVALSHSFNRMMKHYYSPGPVPGPRDTKSYQSWPLPQRAPCSGGEEDKHLEDRTGSWSTGVMWAQIRGPQCRMQQGRGDQEITP